MSKYDDTYLGPGGRFVRPRSEGMVLRAVVDKLVRAKAHAVARDSEGCKHARTLLDDAIAQLSALCEQVSGGYHKNPALVVYGNPPMEARLRDHLRGPVTLRGVMSHNVHALQYTHLDDGKQYNHDFDHETWMIGIERHGKHDIVLTSPEGNPIWQDF